MVIKHQSLKKGIFVDFEVSNGIETIIFRGGKITKIEKEHVYVNKIKVPKTALIKKINK